MIEGFEKERNVSREPPISNCHNWIGGNILVIGEDGHQSWLDICDHSINKNTIDPYDSKVVVQYDALGANSFCK